ncbi:hypothetical protein [Streptomyces sp. SID10815]|uniref:hypothetical protein n=1 Tax=Streptomyces sp. SID10815 TaxID=2706027 RepID=UPI0013C7328E|nr:hypothetical protein [Streptomyces sp. SID10815]NEA46708.1 hypothetical protein [Streptomyces sp. SID10815]
MVAEHFDTHVDRAQLFRQTSSVDSHGIEKTAHGQKTADQPEDDAVMGVESLSRFRPGLVLGEQRTHKEEEYTEEAHENSY